MKKKASDYKRQWILNLITSILWGMASFFTIKRGERTGFLYLFLCILFFSIAIANYKKYKEKIKEQKIKNRK